MKEHIMKKDILDSVYDELKFGDAQKGMEALFVVLKEYKNKSSPQDWQSFVQSCLLHPLKELVHTDPFTRRSFEKPRGYPGDAVLLDMIYFPEKTDINGEPEKGKKIFKYTTNAPACKAVRYRKGYLAEIIDETAERVAKAKIMSVACGHLREAEISSAVKNNSIGVLIALDYDQESLKQIYASHARDGSCVKPLHMSIQDLLQGKASFADKYDLIYCAGLYDYLNQNTAKKLTSLLFNMLQPEGLLLVANFLPGIKDIGYMETYMGWNLIYRDELQLLDVARELPRSAVKKCEVFSEEQENIVFMKISKS